MDRSALAGLRGNTEPRLYTPPLRELTDETSLGGHFIEFARDIVGIELMPWQQWLAWHMLELTDDGRLRFRRVFLLVGRQNGKSTFLQVLSLYFLYMRDAEAVLGMAQDLTTAEKLLSATHQLAAAVPELAAEIKHYRRTNGKHTLELTRSRTYSVAAPGPKAGRGQTIDLAIMDELREHTRWDTWSAVASTTNANDSAMVVCPSNAGTRRSVVLWHFRRLLHRDLGDPDGTYPPEPGEPDHVPSQSRALFEWSAPPGADVLDPDGWRYGQPAMGYIISPETIWESAVSDTDDIFRTEVLCQWVDFLAQAEDELNSATWAGCIDPDAAATGELHLTIDAAPWLASAAIVVWGLDEHGTPVVELAEQRPRAGWLPDRLAEIRAAHGITSPVIYDATGPIAAEADKLDAAGIPLWALTSAETSAALTRFASAVVEKAVKHRGQPEMAAAVAAAQMRKHGDRARFSRTDSDISISPIVAAAIGYAAITSADQTTYQVADSIL